MGYAAMYSGRLGVSLLALSDRSGLFVVLHRATVGQLGLSDKLFQAQSAPLRGGAISRRAIIYSSGAARCSQQSERLPTWGG